VDFYEIPIGVSLGVVAFLVALGVVGSLLLPRRGAGVGARVSAP
jgi:hypothetical protein